MSFLPAEDLSSIFPKGSSNGSHRTPAFSLFVEGQDITAKVSTRINSLTLTDNRGLEADTLEITLADFDGALNLPRRGAKIKFSLGWSDAPLVDKGEYTVDEIEHSGAPDMLRISARSADLRESFTEKRDKSWHGQTIGQIVEEIAKRQELTPAITQELASINIKHIDQTKESDANFLTRMGEQYDAIATVKGGKLLFMKAGECVTASGQPIPTLTITRTMGDQHRFSIADRDDHACVKATWQDKAGAKKQTVTIGDEKGKKGDSSKSKTLRKTYPTKEEAEAAAKAEMDRIQRGKATMNMNLAFGRPELYPETPVKIDGIKTEIDAMEWVVVKVLHNLNDSGYTTQVEMEIKGEKETKKS